MKRKSVTMKIKLKTQWERYTSVVLSWLESIVAVPSSKGGNGVGEKGVERRAVKVGRSSIRSQISCTG